MSRAVLPLTVAKGRWKLLKKLIQLAQCTQVCFEKLVLALSYIDIKCSVVGEIRCLNLIRIIIYFYYAKKLM